MTPYEIPRRFFSQAFRRDALERVLLEGKPAEDVARALAMPVNILHEWLDAERAAQTPLSVPLPAVGRRAGRSNASL